MFSPDRGLRGLPVASCFGGLTFYALTSLLASGCRYQEYAQVFDSTKLFLYLFRSFTVLVAFLFFSRYCLRTNCFRKKKFL